MKKRYDIPKTFIITGIIQAIFFILYLASGLYVIFSPNLEREVLDFFGALMTIIPVMPVCFICNVNALISAHNENGKCEKKVGKWLYIILSAVAMSVAWIFGIMPIVVRF